jgi:AhpD family alkylhydroperoxidase
MSEARFPALVVPTGEPLADELLGRLNAAAGRPVAIFGVLAHRPELLRAWARLGDQLGRRGPLPAALRELTILRVAAEQDCGYVWDQHAAAATVAGLTAGQVAALRDRSSNDCDSWSDRERAVIDVIDEVLSDHAVSAATWTALAATSDAAELVEVLMLISYYAGICVVANALELSDAPPSRGE